MEKSEEKETERQQKKSFVEVLLDKSEKNTKAIYEAARGTVGDIVDVLLIIINDFEKENNNGNNWRDS